MVKIAARFRVSFAIAVLLAVSSTATAADYPRRIAIAPFSILGPAEEIRQTVDVLPRLVSSRLMAMTGAEVLLIPPGNASPENAAKEAGLPLLLKGSVAKLGAGYSIDVTVKDLATGQPAGAFFTAAATEDEIIPRLGDLAADISEKLFGVKAAVRYYPAPQAAQPPVSSPAGSAPTGAPAPLPSGGPGTLPAVAQPAPAPASAPPAPTTAKEVWAPSSLIKVAQTDKIADELYGVVAVSDDGAGNGEIVTWGRNVLYYFHVKGTEILPFTRTTMGLEHHFLTVEAEDVDGDGKKELLVTDLVGDDLQSFVMKKEGDVYEEIAGKIPYFLLVLPDWEGKRVVVGQRRGLDVPFQGKIFRMMWDGKTLRAAEAIPADTSILPLSEGIFGLSSARIGKEWKLIYIDGSDRLRMLNPSGKSEYKSREKYGAASDFFEWGPYLPLEGKRKQFFLRKSVAVSNVSEGIPLFLTTEVKRGVLSKLVGSHEYSRLVLLHWDGGEFVEKAATQKSDHFFSGADFFTPPVAGKGGKVIISAIEQTSTAWKEKVSRLVLYSLE